MKKFLTAAAAFAALFIGMTSCKCTPDPVKPTFEQIINDDYNALKAEDDSLYWWESHITLNKNLEDVKSVKELEPVFVENVYEVNLLVVFKRTDVPTGAKTEERLEDHWLGSAQITPNELKLTLAEALLKYEESDITRTTGNKVVLRQPVNPKFTQPLYIIGQHNSPLFVAVNAVTGEVSQIQ